jgi:ABC-type transporter Mla MlaB component
MTWRVGGIWQPVERVFVGDMPSPGWQDIQVDLTGIAPVDADSTAMAVLVSFGDGLTDVVAIDNVTLARYDSAVAAPSAAGSAQLRVSPNPANPLTTVEFDLDRTSMVELVVYDVRGRMVRTLASRLFEAGVQRVPFDGRDDRGRTLASGVYFVRMETPSRILSERITLVK